MPSRAGVLYKLSRKKVPGYFRVGFNSRLVESEPESVKVLAVNREVADISRNRNELQMVKTTKKKHMGQNLIVKKWRKKMTRKSLVLAL